MDELIFLGTGSSSGTPMLACKCSVCRSKSKFNKRLRPSIFLKIKNKNILIDAGPDIRYQLLKNDIEKIDSLILTHAHYDHMGGMDDLREFCRKQNASLKCYLLKDTFLEVKKRLGYLFDKNLKNHTQSAKFDFHILKKEKGFFNIDEIKFYYFVYFQSHTKVLGIKIKNMAVITDIKRYDEDIFSFLKDIDILILSSLRYEFSPVHFNVEEAIKFANKTSAKKIYLTHLGHELDYKYQSSLPKKFKLAYDGLKIKFS